MRKYSRAAGALAACMMILFWVTAVIRWIAGNGGLMASEMLRNAPPGDTGIPAEEYPAMGALTAAFLTGTGRFQFARAGENGEEILYFHDYEEAHMRDVRDLIRLDTIVMKISFAAAVLITAAGILLRDGEGFCRGILAGLRIMLGIFSILLVWALADFDGLFVTFHRAAFTNDGWLLDPRTDLLIRLMPQRFFISLGIRGALRALAMPVVLETAARAGIHRMRRKNRE